MFMRIWHNLNVVVYKLESRLIRGNLMFKKVSYKQILLLVILVSQTILLGNLQTVSAASGFDGEKAAQWALENYENPSGKGYHDYSREGGDCTNFVSYALRYGGLPMEGAYKTPASTQVWWLRSVSIGLNRNSYTWSRANKLGTYLVAQEKATHLQTISPYEKVNPEEFELGDVIFISTHRSAGTAFHSMIVTEVNPDKVSVTYRNSSDYSPTKNKSLQDIVNDSSHSNHYFIQLRIK